MPKSLHRVRLETPNHQRRRLYQIIISVAICGNAVLAVAKGFVVWISDSNAVFSDAANSPADTDSSLRFPPAGFVTFLQENIWGKELALR